MYERMEISEIENLKCGDCIYIGFNDNNGKWFIRSTVVSPMFWNSDADEPDWEVETSNGFVDIYSIYKKNIKQ